MYISRKDTKRALKKKRQRRFRWLLLVNSLMLICIVGMLALFTADPWHWFSAQRDVAQEIVAATNQEAMPDSGVGNNETQGTQGTRGAQAATDAGSEASKGTANAIDEHAADQTAASADAQAVQQVDSAAADQGVNTKQGTKGESQHTAGQQLHVPTKGEDGLILSFVGDIQASGKVDELLRRKGFDYPFNYAKSLFLSDTLTVANLESPITTGGTPEENKEYVYKSDPALAKALTDAGIDAVTLANNHILDHGVQGLRDTIKYLDEQKITRVGAGENEREAFQFKIEERAGKRIALVGVSRVVPKGSWKAGPQNPGVAEAYDSTRAVAAIKAAREVADLVVVMAHWGAERADYPNDIQQQLAYLFVDAGADLVIGSHPHVLQGVEMYKGKWIAYSLGNFIFTQSTNEVTWETAVLQVTVNSDNSCVLKLIPYYARLGQAVPMNEEDGTKLLARLATISKPLGVGVQSDGYVGTLH